MWNYELRVQTQAFHKEPYKNGGVHVRPAWCEADHADDIQYIFGSPLEKGLPSGRLYTEEEKNLSIRMMQAWSNFAKNGILETVERNRNILNLGNPGWEQYTVGNKVRKIFNTPSDGLTKLNENDISRMSAVQNTDKV